MTIRNALTRVLASWALMTASLCAQAAVIEEVLPPEPPAQTLAQFLAEQAPAGGQPVIDPATITPEALLAARRAPADLFERIVVVGASVSYGHGLSREVGKPVGFAEILDAALLGEHGRVHGHADWFLFSRSLVDREAMLRRALAREPTLVVAPDFLFWYAYGQVPSEERRPWMFEKALALLDEFSGCVVVGDLPWLERSVGRTDGLLPGLQPYQLPPRETVRQLNARLAEWAAERPRAVVVPLSDFVAQLIDDQPFSVGDSRWEQSSRARLLQNDWLHPTLEGAAALSVLCLQELRAGLLDVPGGHIETDVARVVSRVLGEDEG